MPKLNGRLPEYRLHKHSGRAVVTLNGEDHYLGPHGTDASRAAYDRLIARWLAGGRQPLPPADAPAAPDGDATTVNAVILKFWHHAEAYYRHLDGTPTGELDNYRHALRPLRRLYGTTAATEFGPRALEILRRHMIELGWSRKSINRQVHRICAIFKWAAGQELLPESVYQRIKTLAPLKRGRTTARETPRVVPVPEHLITPLRAFLSDPVWAMIRLQVLAGLRPEDAVRLRPADLKVGGAIWTAEPEEHKTAYREHRRTLYFGPKAQAVLRPFVEGRAADAFLFSPREAEADRRATNHAARRTPLSCGNRPGTRRAAQPRRRPNDRYTVASYRRAIQRACDQAFPPPPELARRRVAGRKGKRWETVPEWKERLGPEGWRQLAAWQKAHRWHPHRLRHNAATEIRKEFGVEMSRVVLGVRSISMAELYGERDAAQAMKVVSAIG